MRLYHRPGAGRPFRVAWALEEAGGDYEVVRITPEEGRSEEHLARQPLGRVPAFEDGHGPLFESTALCLHIGELYPSSGLMPPEASHDRGLVQQWAIFAMTELEPPALTVWRERDRNPELAEKAANRAARAAAALEDALSGSPPFLVGDRLTVADIVGAEVLRAVVTLGVVSPSALVTSYLGALEARPAYARAKQRLAN